MNATAHTQQSSVQQLPDISHVGPGIRAAVFVFRQPWVLWPAIVATIAICAFFVVTSLERGRFSGDTLLLLALIGPPCGFGAAVLTGFPAFFLKRLLIDGVTSEVAGDVTLWEAKANHFLGDEGRGGRILLTATHLVFIPHRYNFQLDTVALPLDDITSVAWRRVIARAGMVMSNTLEVVANQAEHTFVVKNAGKVAAVLEAARTAASDDRPTVVDRELKAQELV